MSYKGSFVLNVNRIRTIYEQMSEECDETDHLRVRFLFSDIQFR